MKTAYQIIRYNTFGRYASHHRSPETEALCDDTVYLNKAEAEAQAAEYTARESAKENGWAYDVEQVIIKPQS